jgi:hypothetical protein
MSEATGKATEEFRQAVSRETGVPVEFLRGNTAAEVWDSAQRLVDWKDSGLRRRLRPLSLRLHRTGR